VNGYFSKERGQKGKKTEEKLRKKKDWKSGEDV